jgi:hypothetical protein
MLYRSRKYDARFPLEKVIELRVKSFDLNLNYLLDFVESSDLHISIEVANGNDNKQGLRCTIAIS